MIVCRSLAEYCLNGSCFVLVLSHSSFSRDEFFLAVGFSTRYKILARHYHKNQIALLSYYYIYAQDKGFWDLLNIINNGSGKNLLLYSMIQHIDLLHSISI